MQFQSEIETNPLVSFKMAEAAHYSLELLRLMDEEENSIEQPPLGLATRSGVENSSYNVPAHRLLRALIIFSPSPETIAREFLYELSRCGNPTVEMLAEIVYSGECPDPPSHWAEVVHQHLRDGGDLQNLTQLGTYYLSHLVIPFRNPGGKKTPQDSIDPYPDLKRIDEIQELLENATVNRSQSALRDLVFLRDGKDCLLSRLPFFPPRPVVARCAHIIPFSVHSKIQTVTGIERFTGGIFTPEMVQSSINHPRNALNLQKDLHDSMHKHLAWGIEAILSNGQWKYHYRVVRSDYTSPTTRLKDGDEIRFGSGEGGDLIAKPDPIICNLQLAVSRVSYASGASEIFDQFLYDDDDDIYQLPVYFGGPFVSDDVLMRRLEALAS